MRKKILLVGMCVMLAFSAYACKKDDTSKEKETTSSEKAPVSGKNEKDKVVDGDGKVVELADYTKLEADKSVADVTEESIESSIKSIASDYPVTEGTVGKEDVVNIDYVGKMDGKEFEGGTAEGQTLDIANSTYIKGFAEGLIGKKIGDTVELNLTFPKEYKNNEELAGKDVVFTVTINSKNPEVTDEFVKKNLKDEYDVTTVKELEAYVEEQMKLGAIYDEVWIDYLESCVVEVPEKEVDELVEQGLSYYESYVQSMAEDYTLEKFLEEQGSTMEEFEEALLDEATVTVKEKLIIKEIADKEKITVSDEEYEKEVKYYMESYDYDSREEFDKDYPKETVVENVLYYEVVEWVCGQVELVEEEETTAKDTDKDSEDADAEDKE